jgi:hypothetical protein
MRGGFLWGRYSPEDITASFLQQEQPGQREQRPGQQRQQPEQRRGRQQAQRQRRGQQQEPELAQQERLPLSYRKQPKQRPTSERRSGETCSFDK